ncbi:MAG: peptidoglycan DD-metalloendopeptidase family protein [Microbacteriaceae bacterium]|nr:peptidoglycan DD-metalloendopeptidase family protein [Microbacteriaceae bacterium]
MRRGHRALTSAVVLSVVTAALLVPTTAAADDYPTWDDVVAAQNNEAAAASAVQQIQALLVQLQAEVERTKADLVAKGKKWQEIDAQYQAKKSETAALLEQRDAAESIAVESERRAGQWAAQVVRIGGADPTLSLFAASDHADELLSAIGVSSRISDQANTLYEQAIQQRNTAQSLSDQATVMQTELQRLEQEAAAAMAAAEAASQAATQAVIEQRQHQAELEAQLAVLQQQRAVTEADYNTGVQVRAQQRLAALGVDWGQVSASGWVRPAGGWISSGYGYADAGYGGFHKGVDLAQSCWNPIVAAHDGWVESAGWNSGGYGYLTVIDHGGGVETWYAHQPEGGQLVSAGQHVETGQQIGYVGTTGNSTGCHLHFGVYINGNLTDPTEFLAALGVYL